LHLSSASEGDDGLKNGSVVDDLILLYVQVINKSLASARNLFTLSDHILGFLQQLEGRFSEEQLVDCLTQIIQTASIGQEEALEAMNDLRDVRKKLNQVYSMCCCCWNSFLTT